MGQLRGVGDHAVVNLAAADLDDAEADVAEKAGQLLQIARLCGRRGHEDHVRAGVQLRVRALVAGLGEARHRMAAGVAYAAGLRQRADFRRVARLDADQVHDHGPLLHLRDPLLQEGHRGGGVEDGNQHVAGGEVCVCRDAVDRALPQRLLGDGERPVPAQHAAVGVLFDGLGHGAADEAQARDDDRLADLVHGLDDDELRHVAGVVLQVLGDEGEAEHLARVLAAQHAGVRRQLPLGEVARCDGRVFDCHLRDAGVPLGQRLFTLAERLDVGGDTGDLDARLLYEQAVVDGQPLRVQRAVREVRKRGFRLCDLARDEVARGHHAVVRLALAQHLDDAGGMYGGQVFRRGDVEVQGED